MVNFNQIDKDYIVRWQSDIENTKERPLHKPSQDQSKFIALGGVWNFAERCIVFEHEMSIYWYPNNWAYTLQCAKYTQWNSIAEWMATVYYENCFN